MAVDVVCSAAGPSPGGASSHCIQCIKLHLLLAIVGLAAVFARAFVVVLHRVSRLAVRCEAQMARWTVREGAPEVHEVRVRSCCAVNLVS